MSYPYPKTIDVPLTTDTAIYASGDVLVTTTAIPLVNGSLKLDQTYATLDHIQVVDASALSGAFDIVFLDSNSSFGAVNAVSSISAANAKNILHVQPIVAGDYKSLGANAVVATIIPALPIYLRTLSSDPTNIYVALISRDTKTYAAAALTLRLSFTIVS